MGSEWMDALCRVGVAVYWCVYPHEERVSYASYYY
jgi:hypothetical protein